MTLKEFRDTIEIMRGVYKFEDEKTVLRVSNDLPSGRHDHITLVTEDSTGTLVTLERNADHTEENPWG